MILTAAICILRSEFKELKEELKEGDSEGSNSTATHYDCSHDEDRDGHDDLLLDVLTGLTVGGAYCVLCTMVCFRRKRRAMQSFRSSFLTVYGKRTQGATVRKSWATILGCNQGCKQDETCA